MSQAQEAEVGAGGEDDETLIEDVLGRALRAPHFDQEQRDEVRELLVKEGIRTLGTLRLLKDFELKEIGLRAGPRAALRTYIFHNHRKPKGASGEASSTTSEPKRPSDTSIQHSDEPLLVADTGSTSASATKGSSSEKSPISSQEAESLATPKRKMKATPASEGIENDVFSSNNSKRMLASMSQSERGFFGIGIVNCKRDSNLGSLWRSALVLGASFIFTIGSTRYKKQTSDVFSTWTKIPLYHYSSFEEFLSASAIPYSCLLVGVELLQTAQPLVSFRHPDRCIYLLGSEDNGLPKEISSRCHRLLYLPGDLCLNVSVCGAIVMYDRHAKLSSPSPSSATS